VEQNSFDVRKAMAAGDKDTLQSLSHDFARWADIYRNNQQKTDACKVEQASDRMSEHLSNFLIYGMKASDMP
jgi:hypothetical protein